MYSPSVSKIVVYFAFLKMGNVLRKYTVSLVKYINKNGTQTTLLLNKIMLDKILLDKSDTATHTHVFTTTYYLSTETSNGTFSLAKYHRK